MADWFLYEVEITGPAAEVEQVKEFLHIEDIALPDFIEHEPFNENDSPRLGRVKVGDVDESFTQEGSSYLFFSGEAAWDEAEVLAAALKSKFPNLEIGGHVSGWEAMHV